MIQAAAELDDINNELTKSFKNTNYSQWERKKPSNPTAVKPKPCNLTLRKKTLF